MPSFCSLFSCLSAFMPLFLLSGSLGSGQLLSSAKVLFGGEQSFLVDGVYYSYSLNLNIGLLIGLQCFALSALAFFLSKGSIKLSAIGFALALAGEILFACGPVLLNLSSPSLVLSDIHFGPGAGLLVFFGGLAILVGALYLGKLIVQKARKKGMADSKNNKKD